MNFEQEALFDEIPIAEFSRVLNNHKDQLELLLKMVLELKAEVRELKNG